MVERLGDGSVPPKVEHRDESVRGHARNCSANAM